MNDTRWYHVLAYFVGGFFFANFWPHFVAGIDGGAFQSPFATPPGVGLSSSITNVAWALANLAVAYALLLRVGKFEHKKWAHLLPAAAGFAIGALQLSYYFGKFHGGTT